MAVIRYYEADRKNVTNFKVVLLESKWGSNRDTEVQGVLSEGEVGTLTTHEY